MNPMKKLTLGGLLLSALCFGWHPTALAGLDDPPPDGLKVLYMFTGVRSVLGDAGSAATSIHCTSFAAGQTQLRVNWFNTNGVLQADHVLFVSSGDTVTFSTRATEFYADNAGAHLSLLSGSARILTNGSTNVVCTGQVLDPIGDPPSYIVALPGFSKNGKIR